MEVQEIADLITTKEQTVSVAEADTCGLIGYMFSTVPGSSRWFPGGVIAYTGGLKQSILGVSDALYNTKGSVSPDMAIAMARGVVNVTGTDYGVSVTGVAGPTGGRSGLPVGTFYIGLAGPDNLDVAERIQTDGGDRDGNKRQAAQAGIDLLVKRGAPADRLAVIGASVGCSIALHTAHVHLNTPQYIIISLSECYL